MKPLSRNEGDEGLVQLTLAKAAAATGPKLGVSSTHGSVTLRERHCEPSRAGDGWRKSRFFFWMRVIILKSWTPLQPPSDGQRTVLTGLERLGAAVVTSMLMDQGDDARRMRSSEGVDGQQWRL